MAPGTPRAITIEVTEETYAYLEVLARSSLMFRTTLADVPAVLSYLAHSAADGLRRPGSWERGWVEQAFGDDWSGALEPVPDLPFVSLRPKRKASP